MPKKRSKYATRERDFVYMGWVKQQPCMAIGMSQCIGAVEADHAGERPMGRKAPDDTCIPLCNHHHRQRTDFSGPFRPWDKQRMRAWLDDCIATTRTRYAVRGTSDLF